MLLEYVLYHLWARRRPEPSKGLGGYGTTIGLGEDVVKALDEIEESLGRMLKCYEKYGDIWIDRFERVTILKLVDREDTVIILVALGSDGLEALVSMLAGVELPEELERLIEGRLARLVEACRQLGGCEGISDGASVMVRLGLAADMLVKGILDRLEVARRTVPLVGGVLHQLVVTAWGPLRISLVEPLNPGVGGCRLVWHGVTEEGYTVYYVSKRECGECPEAGAVVCVELEGLGEACFDTGTIESRSKCGGR